MNIALTFENKNMTDIINKTINLSAKTNTSTILEDLIKFCKEISPLIEPMVKQYFNFINSNTENKPNKTNEQLAVEELYKIISFCGIDFVKEQVELFEKTEENFKDVMRSKTKV
ncbi:MAG: hypothetical protein AABW67_02475 [Nanoarchaeota archaeon]